MKYLTKKTLLVLLIIFICIGGILLGCSDGSEPDNPNEPPAPSKPSEPNVPDPGPEKPLDTFTVSLTENDEKYEIVSNNPVTVTDGGSAQFKLKMKNNFCVDKVVRQGNDLNANIVNDYDSTTIVTLHEIEYSIKIDIECVAASAYISYYPNGGSYIDGGDKKNPYTVGHALKSRYRPNTETGTDRISRSGYVLIGWNTKPDGSGEQTGLGSRITLEKNKTLNLYAEWLPMSDTADFEYVSRTSSVTVTKYTGGASCVVIPDKIGGKPLESIERESFSGDITTVVFSPAVKYVAPGAFVNCSLTELYFYDNISSISDSSFVNCPDFATLHINAIEKPRYGPKNLYSEIHFADKYDILILNADKKKKIVFGGSGAYMSVDTMQMEKETDDYVCINMAVNGWFNAAAQFDMMLPYIGEEDIFVHVPESSSMFAYMYSVTMTPKYNDFTYNKLRMYYCLESNYDLISLIDIRNVEDILDGFTEFNAERMGLTEVSYTDYVTSVNLFGTKYSSDTGWIDERGNFALPQNPRGNAIDAGESDIVAGYVTAENAYTRLNSYYSKIRAKGAEVYFITAPINKDTLDKRLKDPDSISGNNGVLLFARPEDFPFTHTDFGEWVSEFEDAINDYLDCNVLLPLSETLYKTADFFDSDYHLSDAAAEIYTGKIIEALKKQ